MNISDYFVQIEKLTNTNLKILNALNESFQVNKDYVSVDLGENSAFNIPAFLMLENKINALQNNFENLVKAPTTGEASFIFNGDSKTIELKKYEQAPAPLSLEIPENFYHENNNILKDFITPVPYLKFDLNNIPNDINTVIIRKVAAVSNDAKARFADILGGDTSKKYNWGDLYKALVDLKQDEDYVLYDTTKKLPTREGQGDGIYVIKSINDNYIDDNLDQHVVLTFANGFNSGENEDEINYTYQNTPTYLLFDQTIEKKLQIGDYLISFDGHAKFQIEDINFESFTMKLRIMYGEYINLTPWSGEGTIDDTSKLRFFSKTDLFSDENYVKVTLEEDQYIYVAIATLNDRMNIRSSWGDGVIINVNNLYSDDDVNFIDYYKNCRNIGDILNEISKVMSNTTTSHSKDELNDYMSAKPIIDTDIVKVIHINKHLDESTTIKNIRALYSQKNSYNANLSEIQTSLTALQDQLSSIDFEDTTGIRTRLQNQIDALTKQKNELINSLVNISNEIALTANNSVVPIENAKYRIRGFFDFKGFIQSIKEEHPEYINNINEGNIKGIYVQYRYRNIQLETGSAETFTKDSDGENKQEVYIYSDWNQLNTRLRLRVRDENGDYVPEGDTSNMNLPSFNQIDIPISQGENVDVRLKVIYDFGYPFIQMMSEWSDIVTFEFPTEFLKDVTITSILEENNNDIETNRFNSILNDNGITKHVDDSVLDQDVTFFHKPENISSGFYTEERRIIPLRDKLKTMDDAITRIVDEIEGTTSEDLGVYIDYDESSIQLSPFENGNITLQGYEAFTSNDNTGAIGNYEFDSDGIASIVCDIRLVNNSKRSLKIFSMFPGGDDIKINSLVNYAFNPANYSESTNQGVWIKNPTSMVGTEAGITPSTEDDFQDCLSLQTTNQILTYRIKNPYDNTPYYEIGSNNIFNKDNKLSWDYGFIKLPAGAQGMAIYPLNIKKDGLLMTFKEAYSYMLLNPGDEYIFPFVVEYKLGNGDGDTNIIQKTLAFDIRTSLYKDPAHYVFKINAKYQDEAADKLVSALNKRYSSIALNNKEYNPIVK